jgi:hypothetical protein
MSVQESADLPPVRSEDTFGLTFELTHMAAQIRGKMMPEPETIDRAERDKAEGKSPSTQAGEFVREEMHHVREGKHGARSPQQAIAIGLSKARRAGGEAGGAQGRPFAGSSAKTGGAGPGQGPFGKTEGIAKTLAGDRRRFEERKRIERFKVRTLAAGTRSREKAWAFVATQCGYESRTHERQRGIAAGWAKSGAQPVATFAAVETR